MVGLRAACALAALLAISAHAAPTGIAASLARRQSVGEAPFDGPRTIETQDVKKVTTGNIVTQCKTTFEAIVVNGANQVRQIKTCSELFVPNGQPLPPPPVSSQKPPVATTGPAPTDPSSAPAPLPTPPASPAPGGDDTTTASDSASTSVPPANGGAQPSPDQPDRPADTSAPSPAQPTTVPEVVQSTEEPAGGETPSTDAPAGGNAPVSTTPDGASNGPSPSTTAPGSESTVTGTRANTEASQSAPPGVNVPGKSIEVLPIGLGVFAGISVIALVVVGLTTYERTKYRKTFRERRLASSGAEMGNGGMSERR